MCRRERQREKVIQRVVQRMRHQHAAQVGSTSPSDGPFRRVAQLREEMLALIEKHTRTNLLPVVCAQALASWVNYVNTRKRLRSVMSRLLGGRRLATLAVAMGRWTQVRYNCSYSQTDSLPSCKIAEKSDAASDALRCAGWSYVVRCVRPGSGRGVCCLACCCVPPTRR